MSSPSSTASSDPVAAHHKINYVEFASAYPQQSCDFFAALFGWRRESFGPDYVCLSIAPICAAPHHREGR